MMIEKVIGKIAPLKPHVTPTLKVWEIVQSCKHHKRRPSIRALAIRDPF